MYNYLTLAQLRSALLLRLQDVSAVNMSVAEANLYIIEALRVLNAQTQAPGIIDFTFDFKPGRYVEHSQLHRLSSPAHRHGRADLQPDRSDALRSEPMSGGVWTGTTQFNIAQLANSLQYRRYRLADRLPSVARSLRRGHVASH